ncbi:MULTISPECIES: helix-turn-helix domain-containing protein [Serratia]|uniref:helix-turn-helix domain-containing protein n=1 Tax=Serratia TaxID=613 RepID=UPI000F7F5189|nr:XRE family transcriptional regulator [Serratia marcescens]MDT8206233.1 XRE family transcriptional regulator [Serratia marcescens]RTF45619.1 XRE family transcriptional regulator [Serratia marcescens]HAT3713170.1 helix-turn-helix domain-containing protein [Serratia marcescens]HAT3795617.1 helix-turn-helix domain-containing protein [Serratia marcescens]HAT4917548.1 helix-turn-helix domain-containing protein [Serratia marcescens]
MDNGLETADLRLAQRLADLRQQQGWSLEELAQRTGLSRATLSRVERAETSPTASLLNRLCAAYGLTMSRLLSDIEDEPPELLRPQQQPVWVDRVSGFHRRSVSPPAALYKAEFIEARLDAGAQIDYDLPSIPALEHHLWLLSGQLELTLEGRVFRLSPGDCLRYRLFGASRFHVPGDEPAHYTLVICRP